MSARTFWRLVPAMAIAVAALGVSAVSASAATTRIAYIDFTGPTADDEIFIVRPDGTHRHQVTHFTSGFMGNPAWGPKQKKLVFSRSNSAPSHLYTIRPNGTHLHKIPHTKFAIQPAWSPNGKRIAYVVENSDGKSAIYTIGVNGKHRKRLTTFKQNFTPDWSPSGKSIAYSSADGVVRMRSNGRHKLVVSSSGYDPSWAPNGKTIAFVDKALDPEAETDIYTIRINGTHRRNLTQTRPATCGGEDPEECRRNDELPAWSPNGKRVLFDETTSGGGDAGIFTVKPDGTGFHQVTTSGHGGDW